MFGFGLLAEFSEKLFGFLSVVTRGGQPSTRCSLCGSTLVGLQQVVQPTLAIRIGFGGARLVQFDEQVLDLRIIILGE